MARLFPNTPVGSITTETIKVYRLLRSLPDDYSVWLRLAFWNEPGPDFWVLRDDGRAALLKVSSATTRDLRTVQQSSLFDGNSAAEPVGRAEQEALCRFAERVAQQAGRLTAILEQVTGVVAFPNVPSTDLKQVMPPPPSVGISWASRDDLTTDKFGDWLAACLGTPLSAEVIALIRKTFAPEVVIPPQFTVRKPIERNVAAQLTGYLLDYDQEWAVKIDLDLSEDARAAANEFGLRLINGVAGSGKSLIIVYRAYLLRRLYPDKRILVLTHNRPLIHDLEARYRHLTGKGRPVEWRTFLKWCQIYWPKSEPWRTPIGQRRRREVVTQVWRTQLDGTSISERMLQDEIDWFKDRTLVSLEDYLAADRSGRGFALNESMRRRMFTAMVAYQNELNKRRWIDWEDVPRKLWRFLGEERVKPPDYDVILVDEAQFFAPIWFEIIKKTLKPVTGHLFLVADPTQGFLKRGQSWLASGLEVRGRSQRLDKSYRTTLQILNFATTFYRLRLPDLHDEDIVVPDLNNMPVGVCPETIPLTSEQDEITRAVNEIKRAMARGVHPEHILIIHADWQGAQRMLYRLRKELGPEAAADPKETPKGNHIRVCTLNAATGLESPVVFLMGVHSLFEEEQSVRLSDEERVELVRDNTRKLYMAFTRAGQRLVITHVGEPPDILIRSIALCQRSQPEGA
jgi:hypothetical protein